MKINNTNGQQLLNISSKNEVSKYHETPMLDPIALANHNITLLCNYKTILSTANQHKLKISKCYALSKELFGFEVVKSNTLNNDIKPFYNRLFNGLGVVL